jgi:hypothetical protein
MHGEGVRPLHPCVIPSAFEKISQNPAAREAAQRESLRCRSGDGGLRSLSPLLPNGVERRASGTVAEVLLGGKQGKEGKVERGKEEGRRGGIPDVERDFSLLNHTLGLDRLSTQI